MNRLLIFLLLVPLSVYSQDIHFSQYLYSPANLNPALTGLFQGDVRANALYRQQWNSVTVPYKTFSLGYEQLIPQFKGRNAAGIAINNDVAGDGDFGTLQVLLSFSRLIRLDADSMHFLSAGIQGGFSYRNLKPGQLKFDNQFNGDVFDPMLASGENFSRTSYLYPEINAGIVYMHATPSVNAKAGISFQHVFSPEQSFLDESAKLPSRFQAFVSPHLFQENQLSLLPSLLYMHQKEFSEITAGAEVILHKAPLSPGAVSIALHHRFKDALIPSLALYYDSWRFGISYDVNTSGLRKASNQRGGPELNVTYILRKIRYIPSKFLCPVY